MKALVLGGAGAVCSETTRDLAETSSYEEIMVAESPHKDCFLRCRRLRLDAQTLP